MKQFSNVIFFVLALIYLAPAQAMVNIDDGMSLCMVFSEEEAKEGGTTEGKKKDGKKKDKKAGDEEEPDCD